MREKDSRYLDPLTDYGFKRILGSEPDKDIMIDFLNALFEGEKIIVDIAYSPTEQLGEDAKDKRESELVTDLDKWFYLLKNLNRLDKIPDFLDKRVFQKIFKIAEMSKMTKEERELYHSDVKAKSDWNAGIRYAEKKAEEKGRHEQAVEMAVKLKARNMPVEEIAELTGLPIEEIEKL